MTVLFCPNTSILCHILESALPHPSLVKHTHFECAVEDCKLGCSLWVTVVESESVQECRFLWNICHTDFLEKVSWHWAGLKWIITINTEEWVVSEEMELFNDDDACNESITCWAAHVFWELCQETIYPALQTMHEALYIRFVGFQNVASWND